MSSKEEKRQRKLQKQEAEKRREKMVSILTRVSIAVVTVLAIYVFYQGLFAGPPALPPDRVAAHDHVRGNPEAPLTITVYADFQCPSCASEMELIDRSWDRVEDNAQLVFRHFPLDTHRHSFLAARYAEAAARQGKFWEMHDLLFENQRAWAGLEEAAPQFDAYAQRLGLDMEQLEQDLNSSEVRDKIVADQQGGVRAGVRGTPTMFFNGRQVDTPRSSSGFQSMVNEAISGL